MVNFTCYHFKAKIENYLLLTLILKNIFINIEKYFLEWKNIDKVLHFSVYFSPR